MTKRVFLTLLIPSLLLAADNQPIVGWGKTAWGMSLEDIIRVYPEAKAVPQDARVKPEIREKQPKASIDTLEIAGDDYSVQFYLKPKTGLYEVVVIKDFIHNPETRFDDKVVKLQSILTAKYGEPKLREPQQNGGVRSTWITPNLTVVLFYVYDSVARVYLLDITYTPPPKDALDKL